MVWDPGWDRETPPSPKKKGVKETRDICQKEINLSFSSFHLVPLRLISERLRKLCSHVNTELYALRWLARDLNSGLVHSCLVYSLPFVWEIFHAFLRLGFVYMCDMYKMGTWDNWFCRLMKTVALDGLLVCFGLVVCAVSFTKRKDLASHRDILCTNCGKNSRKRMGSWSWIEGKAS